MSILPRVWPVCIYTIYDLSNKDTETVHTSTSYLWLRPCNAQMKHTLHCVKCQLRRKKKGVMIFFVPIYLYIRTTLRSRKVQFFHLSNTLWKSLWFFIKFSKLFFSFRLHTEVNVKKTFEWFKAHVKSLDLAFGLAFTVAWCRHTLQGLFTRSISKRRK